MTPQHQGAGHFVLILMTGGDDAAENGGDGRLVSGGRAGGQPGKLIRQFLLAKSGV
jgi:hypothetical protein